MAAPRAFAIAGRRLEAWLGPRPSGGFDWRGALSDALTFEADHGRLGLWIAPALASGLILHLSLTQDPPAILIYPMASLALAAALLLRHRVRFAFWTMLAAAFGLGLMSADIGIRRTATPRIEHSIADAVVRGYVVRVDHRHDRPPRMLLEVVSIGGLAPDNTPERLTLTGNVLADLTPGLQVEITALLRPHPPPTHPGAYDPGFPGFFSRVGGTGVVREPPRRIELPRPTGVLAWRLAVEAYRDRLTRRIMELLGPRTGPFAAALVTGVRSALPEDSIEEFSASGLSHMLVIAGLHMTLVAGGVYRILRKAFALFPVLALNLPVKKLAAIGGLLTALFYEVISGAGISTSRAFVMISVGFLAILCDRPAISMRNLAISAVILLALDPSAILSVSFQMSYAATGIIVAAYERRLLPRLAHHEQPAALRFLAHAIEALLGVAIISTLAGVAVAPFELHHFHHIAWFGVAGNVLATFVMEFLVMPGTILALVALPFGIEEWVLPFFGFGVDQLVAVARFVGTLPGASSRVSGFGALALAVSSFGLVWACLWRGRLALLGVVPYVLGILIGLAEPRPDLYVSPGADTVAARGPAGRLVIDQLGHDTFVVQRWLEADSDRRRPNDATLTQGRACDPAGCTITTRAGLIIAVPRSAAALDEDCRFADIVVTRSHAPPDCPRPSLVLDREVLQKAQGVSVRLAEARAIVTSIADSCGTRPWCPIAEPRDFFGRPYALRKPRGETPRRRPPRARSQ